MGTNHKRCVTIKGILSYEYEAPIPHPILIFYVIVAII